MLHRICQESLRPDSYQRLFSQLLFDVVQRIDLKSVFKAVLLKNRNSRKIGNVRMT